MNHSALHTRILLVVLLGTASFCLSGCMKWDYGETEEVSTPGNGLFIVNEGNFQYGNATLSYYDPATGKVENEIFFRANGFKLGDVAQSMAINGETCWITVNNSHVIFAIDINNCREKGRIEGLPSPRYIHFVSEEKAYVSQLWDNRIFIIDPRKYEVVGAITVPGMSAESGSTEQMVRVGDYVYVACWSYQDRIIKIDTRTDEVVGSLRVGMQPNSLVADREGNLWTITDGGYPGSPLGSETPALCKIDTGSFSVAAQWMFGETDTPSELQISGEGTMLTWINKDIWQMPTSSAELPTEPFIRSRNTIYYGLTVDPRTGDVYVADAIDYQQAGKIYRYDSLGWLVDEFYAGIIPGAFAWK